MKIYKATHIVDKSFVTKFTSVTKDFNPIHWDEEFCLKTFYKKPIAPGAITTSLLHTLLAENMPGVILTNERIHYLKPVFVGDELILTITVSDSYKKGNTQEIAYKCWVDKQEVLTGKAWIYVKYLQKKN